MATKTTRTRPTKSQFIRDWDIANPGHTAGKMFEAIDKAWRKQSGIKRKDKGIGYSAVLQVRKALSDNGGVVRRRGKQPTIAASANGNGHTNRISGFLGKAKEAKASVQITGEAAVEAAKQEMQLMQAAQKPAADINECVIWMTRTAPRRRATEVCLAMKNGELTEEQDLVEIATRHHRLFNQAWMHLGREKTVATINLFSAMFEAKSALPSDLTKALAVISNLS